MLVIDLYETVIHIMQDNDILESVIGQEAEMHGAKMPIISMAIRTNGRTCRRTTSIRRSQACSMWMRASRKTALANQYQDAAAEQRATSCSSPGIGHVYPYIRAHALLNLIQDIVPANTPVVLFFPGKYEKTATTVSVMRLFNTLAADNYYRAFSLNTMITEGANS